MTVLPPPIPPQPQPVTPAPARPSWWRRNLVALLALVVLAPATALGIGWHEWHQFYGYDSRPFLPTVVEKGGSAELGGATWGPVRTAVVDDTAGFDVPEGTTLIAVGVPVDAGAEGVTCSMPRLVQQETGREWESVRWEIGLLPDSEEPEYCTVDDTGAYELLVPFLVPDDVEGPFWVDVWPHSAGGSFLRFPVAP